MSRSRRAVSLIELLIVMSACTVVLTLTSALLCRVMRIQVESRTQDSVERSSLRLSEQFRHDVHRAQTAVTNRADLDGDVFLQLRFPSGQQAEYTRQGGTVLRQMSGNGGQVSREEYAFPANSKLRVQQTATPPRITLTISVRPNEATTTHAQSLARVSTVPVSLQAECLLGRDLRFATASAGQEISE